MEVHIIDSNPALIAFLQSEGIPFQDVSNGTISINTTSGILFEIARAFERSVQGKKSNLSIS